eukprot:GFYU01007659.1.p1 GENE.GFYU01007659.1~~GFYU01007659.1.p1  ORF type:complete len:464 (-),score=68.06 GFYU01007659.1:344-1690(-)
MGCAHSTYEQETDNEERQVRREKGELEAIRGNPRMCGLAHHITVAPTFQEDLVRRLFSSLSGKGKSRSKQTWTRAHFLDFVAAFDLVRGLEEFGVTAESVFRDATRNTGSQTEIALDSFTFAARRLWERLGDPNMHITLIERRAAEHFQSGYRLSAANVSVREPLQASDYETICNVRYWMAPDKLQKTDVRAYYDHMRKLSMFLLEAGEVAIGVRVCAFVAQVANKTFGEHSLEHADALFAWGDSMLRHQRKTHTYVSSDMLDTKLGIRGMYELGLSIRRQNNDAPVNIARALILCIEIYNSIQEHPSHKREFRTDIQNCISEAKTILQSTGDPEKITAFLLQQEALQESLRGRHGHLLEAAAQRCMDDLGPCMLLSRIYYNLMIFHEENRDMDSAYAAIKKGHDIVLRLFGPDHSQTKSCAHVMEESAYLDAADRAGKQSALCGLRV